MNNKIISLSHKRQMVIPIDWAKLNQELVTTQERRNLTKEIWEDAETMAIICNEVTFDNQQLIQATADYMNALEAWNRAVLEYRLYRFIDLYTKEIDSEIELLEKLNREE